MDTDLLYKTGVLKTEQVSVQRLDPQEMYLLHIQSVPDFTPGAVLCTVLEMEI
jgi:hypothetical protein